MTDLCEVCGKPVDDSDAHPTNLKCCPFCGNPGNLAPEPEGGYQWYVHCFCDWEPGQWFDSCRQAREAWNAPRANQWTRVEDQPVPTEWEGWMVLWGPLRGIRFTWVDDMRREGYTHWMLVPKPEVG